jgi:hypothetical protein
MLPNSFVTHTVQVRSFSYFPSTKNKEERAATFTKICAEHRFTSASLSAFVTICKTEADWSNRLGAHETQKIADRAFAAVGIYCCGKRGRPRFNGASRPLHSIVSKANAAGIRWKAGTGSIKWNGLVIPTMLAPESKYYYQLEALTHPTKYCRFLWRIFNGKRRWYVQLVQEGHSPVRHEIARGNEVGLDVGPSTIAVVSEQTAELVAFCPTIKQPWKKIRKIQRALNRSRRATNPDSYNDLGTWKKGRRQTVFSTWYVKLKAKLADAKRRLAAERKRSHSQRLTRFFPMAPSSKARSFHNNRFRRTSACLGGSGTCAATVGMEPYHMSGNAKVFNTVYPLERVVRRRKLAICHGPDVVAETREPGDPDGFCF